MHRRLRIGFFVALAAAALSSGLCSVDNPARSQTRTAPDEAEPATAKVRPILEAGPLAQPKSLDQVGLPAELMREAIPRDNPQTPTKSPSVRNCSSMAAYRQTGPWRAPPAMIPPALSPTAGP